jgi:RNA polymerase sigma-70 factor (ECF subfamily)
MAERAEPLIGRVAGGDEKAFEELYNLTARSVFAYLRSRGVDRETAADILQETFAAAWRGAGRYRGGAKPLTWLIAIARHKLADAMRARAGPAVLKLEDDSAAEGRDPTAQTVERLDMKRAVETLGEEHRELLHLIFALGMNYAEAAEVLEVPEGTVKSRMFAIKRQLAGRLGEVGA